MLTCLEIITLAYSRQKRAAPELDEDVLTSELLPIIYESVCSHFQVGALTNPEYFMKRETVSYDSTKEGWPRPDDCNSVLRIEDDSTEVVRVPYDDRDTVTDDYVDPVVYGLGGVYYRAASNHDPESGSALTFFYTRIPSKPTDLDHEIDELWPPGHESLIPLEVAIYMTRKDARPDPEIQHLIAQRDVQSARFLSFVMHEDHGVARRIERERVSSIGSLKVAT